MKHSLSSKGLGSSQAQSISNLCNQRCRDITAQLSVINNASKTLTVDGIMYTSAVGHPLPINVVGSLNELARLHATQAFLMENIRAKDQLINDKRRENFKYTQVVDRPKLDVAYPLDNVSESWGWEQLTTAEWQEFIESESYAAHIGQFIHSRGKLDNLRKQLPSMDLLEWQEVEEGKKTPVVVTPHHTMDQLTLLHEDLSSTHKAHEQRVNYFKAKVKNAVTLENARIERANADEQTVVNSHNDSLLSEFKILSDKWRSDNKQKALEFNEVTQKEINRLAKLKIEIPARFQSVVYEFLQGLE